MPGTMKMFCIRMNILSRRNNIELFLACNMAAMQNLYIQSTIKVNVAVVVHGFKSNESSLTIL